MKKKPWGNGLYKRPERTPATEPGTKSFIGIGPNRAQQRKSAKARPSYSPQVTKRIAEFVAIAQKKFHDLKSRMNRLEAEKVFGEWLKAKKAQIAGGKK